MKMNQDDIIYISLLLISIPIGFIFKNIAKSPNLKAILSASIGFLMLLIVCKHDIYHSLVLSLVNSILIKTIHPKFAPYLSFVWSFGYLLFFRMLENFGLPKAGPHANAVQLIITLKTVGLAFEVSDSYKRKKKLSELSKNDQNQIDSKKEPSLEKLKLEIEFQSLEPIPSLLDCLVYNYCYIGILTGPYFKYRTYYDWLNFNKSDDINSSNFILTRCKTLPFIIICFLVISKFVSFQDAAQDEFYDNPLWYRLVYMSIIFTLFRFRFYIAWIFAECSCISATFGAYPTLSKPKPGAGPTDLDELKKFNKNPVSNSEYSFACVNNINEYKCETVVTVKEVLHYWNMTIQYWMASYVYKRIPFKKFGQPITMAVSAYWHGLHPGYYLSMLTTSPCILAEYLMEKGLKKKYLSEKYFKFYNFFAWLFRTREFDYMSLGFILLSYDATIKFWKSVYFIGHFFCLVFIILGYSLILLSKPTKKQKSQTD